MPPSNQPYWEAQERRLLRLEEDQSQTESTLASVLTEIDYMKAAIDDLRDESKLVKTELTELRGDFGEVKDDISDVRKVLDQVLLGIQDMQTRIPPLEAHVGTVIKGFSWGKSIFKWVGTTTVVAVLLAFFGEAGTKLYEFIAK